jgi:hypothetical protein
MKTKLTFLSILGLILSLPFSAFAQDDLAKAAQNPIASLTSVPFQFNFNMGMGDYDRTQFILNVQPVLPAKISKNWNLINRIIIPVMVQPDFNSESGSTTGLGTINYTAFFSPKPFGKVAIGFGPSLLIPTQTSPELGDGQFAVGPSFVIFAGVGKNWTLGFVAAQNWAYYSPTGDPLHTSFFLQYFVNFNMKNSWSIGMAPTITVNWNAEDGEKATVPFGLNVAKVVHLGNQAARFSLAYNYNAIYPQGGAKYGQIQFMFVLLFPKK